MYICTHIYYIYIYTYMRLYIHDRYIIGMLISYVFGIGPSTFRTPHQTFAHKSKREVRHWGQITASSHRSLLRYPGQT